MDFIHQNAIFTSDTALVFVQGLTKQQRQLYVWMNPLCILLSVQVRRYLWSGLHRCRRWCQTRADRMTEPFQFQSERCIIELLILSANIHFVPNLSTAQFCYYESWTQREVQVKCLTKAKMFIHVVSFSQHLMFWRKRGSLPCWCLLSLLQAREEQTVVRTKETIKL